MQKLLANPIILTAVLCLGLAGYSDAQEGVSEETERTDSTVAGQKTPRTNAARRQNEPPQAALKADGLDELEEVVVSAQRVEGDGRRRGVAAGREELDRTDTTSMDDFFDDIEGLSTLGGDDQGNAFSIDGLSADLSNVTLNGQSFGEGRGSGGLGARDLPPDMIRRVEVYKIPTATLEEGGSGGSVNLQLRNPIEIAQPTSTVKGRFAYVPGQGDFNPSASYFSGRPSENRKFGHMFSLSLSERNNGYRSQDISNWVLSEFAAASAYIPGQVRNNDVQDDQRSIFAGLTIAFRPQRSLDIGASVFFNQKQGGVETHALTHRFERQRDLTALAFDGRFVSELDSSDKSRDNLRVVGSTREDETDSLILGLNASWRHSGWRLDGALGYKIDNTGSDSPSQSATFEANSDMSYRANHDGGLVTSYADGFPDVQEFSAGRISLSQRETEDVSAVGGLDVTKALREGFFHRVRFGVKVREMTRDRTSLNAKVNLDDGLTLADFFSGRHRQTPWDTVAWPSSDIPLINAAVGDEQVDWAENLLNVYDIGRHTNAAYVQADFRTSETRKRFLVGNVGVRIVGTDTRINGYQEDQLAIEPISLKNTYTDVLPSLGMRMRIAERAALTLGAARVMTHPAFNDLAPGIRINYADRSGRSGNPHLEPFRATQYLAEVTWAPVRGRRLTANIAYRDVESYFALGEESVEISDDMFLVTRPINGEGGYILSAGVKLKQNLRRLHDALQNWTLFLSYVHNKSSTAMRDPYTGKKLPMPNTAEQVARVDLDYSKNRLTGRMSYQWRGQSLKASVSESGLSVWNQGTGSLNLNLGWRLNEKLRLSLDGRNLLAEDKLRTTDYDAQLWRFTARYRSIAATLRGKW